MWSARQRAREPVAAAFGKCPAVAIGSSSDCRRWERIRPPAARAVDQPLGLSQIERPEQCSKCLLLATRTSRVRCNRTAHGRPTAFCTSPRKMRYHRRVLMRSIALIARAVRCIPRRVSGLRAVRCAYNASNALALIRLFGACKLPEGSVVRRTFKLHLRGEGSGGTQRPSLNVHLPERSSSRRYFMSEVRVRTELSLIEPGLKGRNMLKRTRPTPWPSTRRRSSKATLRTRSAWRKTARWSSTRMLSSRCLGTAANNNRMF